MLKKGQRRNILGETSSPVPHNVEFSWSLFSIPLIKNIVEKRGERLARSGHKAMHKKHAYLRTKKHSAVIMPKADDSIKIISTYGFNSGDIPITIKIYTKKGEFVPIYDISIAGISKKTQIVLQKAVD